MPAIRKVSVVDTLASIVESIRQKRQTCTELLEANTSETEEWLLDAINVYKQKASQLHSDSNKDSARGKTVTLDEALVDELNSLKVVDLKARLRERGLDCNGRKAVLRQRLLEDLEAEAASQEQQINQQPNTRSPPADTEGKIRVGQESCMSPPSRSKPRPMEIDDYNKRQPRAASPPMNRSGNGGSMNQVEKVELEPKKQTDSMHRRESEAQPMDYMSPAPSKPLAQPSKVQSAIKLFSAKSTKHVNSISHTANKSPAVDENEGHSKTAKTASLSPNVSPQFKSHDAQKRILSPSGTNIALPQSSDKKAVSSSGKLEKSSVLKSQSVKEKNEARKARLENIRVASTKVLAAPKAASTLSKLKLGQSSKLGSAASSKSRIVNQMREKALAGKPHQPLSAWKGKLASSGSTQNVRAVVASPQKTNVKSLSPTKAVKSEQAEARSPMDTYEMSDVEDHHEQDEEESDSDDDERAANKRIPSWAHKDNLLPALRKQYDNSVLQDPDEIFGEVQTCNLQAIFNGKKTRYIKRTSSGNWTKDRVTAAEKLTYKRTMGYAQEA